MRIAAMAAGAVGGYFGARLAAAGHDVTFIARGAHLAALRQNGLRIASVLGDVHINAPEVTDDPSAVGPVDIILFAVKLWDTETAAEQMRPLIAPDTRVITLQNGVCSPERVSPIVGEEHVAAGSAYIASVISEPGVIKHTSQFARMMFGRLDRQPDPHLATFAEAATAAGIDVLYADDADRERWQKFVFLTGLSGATAITRMPLGPILADPDTRAFFHDLMRETVAVGRAKGVAIPPDFADDRLRFGEASPPGFKASMLHDLEAGRRLELDWLAGRIIRLGRELSVPTPMNDAVYAALKLHRMGSSGGT
jgi:2-dehydropantoate 2-reductase